MKKSLLFIPLFAATSAMAQTSLHGQAYTQNFDGIGAGLPAGWSVDTGSYATKAGTPQTFDGTKIKWTETRGAFKNFASATGLTVGIDSASQANSTNRALGIRQVSPTSTTFPGTDPGGSFIFKIDQTTGLTGFKLTFKLQSLDTSSPRTATWAIDYATGTAPTTFTPLTTGVTGTQTTGGNTFSNNTITADFGTALNNQSSNVWIRIIALTGTTGSGNRPSTAIDDFNLTWTGIPTSVSELSKQLNAMDLFPNPNNGNFTLKGKLNAANATVEVVNLIGKVVMQKNIAVRNGELNSNIVLDNNAKGVYFLRVTAGNESKTTRFTVL